MEKKQRDRLAQALRARRDYKGWTEAKLAQESGISVETISRLENAKTENPRDYTIRSLAEAFGITSDELAGPRLSPEAMDQMAQTQLDRVEAKVDEVLARLREPPGALGRHLRERKPKAKGPKRKAPRPGRDGTGGSRG